MVFTTRVAAAAPVAEEELDDVSNDKQSTRSAGQGEKNKILKDNASSKPTTDHQSAGGISLGMSSETSLSQLANLDLKYKNRIVQYWLHSRVSLRLFLMLSVPFAALIILLVAVISSQIQSNKVASDLMLLTELSEHCLLVVHELSTEYTACLWWILDKTLQSGITWNTGGLSGKGFSYEFELTSLKLDPMKKFVSTAPIIDVSKKLASKLFIMMDKLRNVDDIRYQVEMFRLGEREISDYYVTLLEGLLDIADLTATLSDSSTVQKAQSHISWVRIKTALERERHTVGMILLLKRFGLNHYTDWTSQIAIQSQWRNRFLSIAPDAISEEADEFFTGEIVRNFEELRVQGLAAFVPNDTNSIPTFGFKDWMDTASLAADSMRDFRAKMTEDIMNTSDNNKRGATMALALYILLAVLAGALSVSIALMVGWSIEIPWNAMLRMKDRMFIKLDEQDKINTITAQFVPIEFLNMMGLKSLFDVQLGNCVLKRATLLCSEIRNFSKLSERMAPQQTFMFLSMWLQDSGPIIRRHGGFIDKFRGSGLTAIFTDPNDTVDASLELLESAHARNQDAAMASVQIDLGIAVHTGDLMLGTVGDQQRMETAVISEALASVLQISNLTKIYEASLLLSRETFMLLNQEGLSARFLGESGTPGQHSHQQVYEVLGMQDEAKMNTMNEFAQAVKLHQAGEFASAIALYESVLQQNPQDKVVVRRLDLAKKQEWVDMITHQ